MSLDGAAAGLLDLLEERLRNIIRDEITALTEVTPTTPEGWMSVDTAAAYLDLTPAALRARVARGSLTAHSLGDDGQLVAVSSARISTPPRAGRAERPRGATQDPDCERMVTSPNARDGPGDLWTYASWRQHQWPGRR